jgi:hypothetical protein
VTQARTARVRQFHSRQFCLRAGEEPEHARASGDSGFVAHLTASSRGATGWEWSFRLTRRSDTFAYVTDGRLTLFLDEEGQYVPADAKVNDIVAVRLPRARENAHPYRFSLHGGQGGPVLTGGYAKLFVPVTYEGAALLVEGLTGRAGDQLHFALHVCNQPADFDKADTAIIDVGRQDEPGVIKALETFLAQHPGAVKPRGLPYSTEIGPLGLPRTEATSRMDLADGYGWRKSQEAVAT